MKKYVRNTEMLNVQRAKLTFYRRKMEIEAYINRLQAADQKNKESLSEAQDILIDLIKIIEEGHCQPFKPKKTLATV